MIGIKRNGGITPIILSDKNTLFPPGPAVDPVLENNSWETIKAVCESGDARSYWSVGDIKTDIGTDSISRDFRIGDMKGLYNKHVAFEETALDDDSLVWNPSTNTDGDNCYNNYSITNVSGSIRYALNNTMLTKLSNELQAILTPTSVPVATNGNNGTIVTVSDKIFLHAAKEVGLGSYARTEENAACSVWDFYTTHNTAADRIRNQRSNNTARSYWTRSAYSGNSHYVVYVYGSGYGGYGSATGSFRCPRCFAL